MAWLEGDAETRLWAVPGSLVAGARPRLCLSERQLSPVPVVRGPSVTCPCCGQGCDLHAGDMKRFHGSVEIRGPEFQLSLSPTSLARVWDQKVGSRELGLLLR